MTHDFSKYVSTVAIVAALTAGPVSAQETDMTEWDTNQDATLSEDEFTTGYEGDDQAMDTWDRDQSGTVSEDEFTTGATGAAERTGNQAWTEQEFADADADQSGDLDRAEMARVIFIVFDADQSGDLSEDEFSAYSEEQQAMDEGDQG